MPLGPGNLNYTKDGFVDFDFADIVASPPKFKHFDFEFHDWKTLCILSDRNPYLIVPVIAVYLMTIFGIQAFMKDRKAFELKKALFFWNAGLGIMSIFGFWRVAPEFIDTLWNEGFHSSVCIRNKTNYPTLFWLAVFAYSKFWELGDTVFLVLRKKPLTFLQWGHHSLTLAMVWSNAAYMEPIARHYSFMNYGVHSLMYPYFALRALDIRVPKRFANLITTLQFVQMIVGMYINIYSAIIYSSDSPCDRHPKSIRIFFGVFGLFIYLFGKLFMDLVVNRKSSKKLRSE